MPINYVSVDSEYEKLRDLKREDVRHIQEWLSKQPHLPELMELDIAFFLHSCKYSIEMAKITIDNNYTMRALSPELFGQRNQEGMKRVLSNYLIAPLPRLAKDGSMVIFSKVSSDPERYSVEDYSKYMDLVLKMTMYERGIFHGLIVVFDATGYGFGHLSRVSVSSLKKFIAFAQESLPVRLVKFHIINFGPILDKLLTMAKPFLAKDMLNMIHMHTGSYVELYDTVPKELLPKEYGGLSESLASLNEKMAQKIANNLDFVEEHEKKVSNEIKRLQKSTRVNELFGIEGSFKKLELD